MTDFTISPAALAATGIDPEELAEVLAYATFGTTDQAEIFTALTGLPAPQPQDLVTDSIFTLPFTERVYEEKDNLTTVRTPCCGQEVAIVVDRKAHFQLVNIMGHPPVMTYLQLLADNRVDPLSLRDYLHLLAIGLPEALAMAGIELPDLGPAPTSFRSY